MIRFKDRRDAGKQLVERLAQYKDNKNVVVLGLPRGGVVTAYEVAQHLRLPLDIIVTRKIGAPLQPELAVGAITQDGEPIFNEALMQQLGITKDDVAPIIEEEKKEAQRRLNTYRGQREPLDLTNKIALLVDDGIATGATMRAAIKTARTLGAQKIIVAVPVLPEQEVETFEREADELVYVTAPSFFTGVGMVYESFAQTTDDEVIDLLSR